MQTWSGVFDRITHQLQEEAHIVPSETGRLHQTYDVLVFYEHRIIMIIMTEYVSNSALWRLSKAHLLGLSWVDSTLKPACLTVDGSSFHCLSLSKVSDRHWPSGLPIRFLKEQIK